MDSYRLKLALAVVLLASGLIWGVTHLNSSEAQNELVTVFGGNPVLPKYDANCVSVLENAEGRKLSQAELIEAQDCFVNLTEPLRKGEAVITNYTGDINSAFSFENIVKWHTQASRNVDLEKGNPNKIINGKTLQEVRSAAGL